MSKITNDFRSQGLRRGLLIKPSKGKTTQAITYAASIELANLGFIVDPKELLEVSSKNLTETINEARKIIGADRDMTPVYPGFPEQVQELSTMTLLVEQILHYWSGGVLIPDYPSVVREGLAIEDMLRNARNLKVVSAAVAARELTEKLVSDPISLSESDKELLHSIIELQTPSLDLIKDLVKTSRNGENIQSLVRSVNSVCNYSKSELVLAVIDNTYNSDVILRAVLEVFTKPSGDKWEKNHELAVNTLADRDYQSVRMLNVPRPVRRAVVNKLGVITKGFKADFVVSRRDLWRKVMTAVHPYDFKLTGDSKRAVDIIHANIEYKTVNAVVEEAMLNKDVKTAVKILAENQPGNLLRRIVALLRLVTSEKEAKLLSRKVKEVGMKSTLTTLISAYNGVLSANDTNARVTRVSGLNNNMTDRSNITKIDEAFVKMILKSIKIAMVEILKTKDAPSSPVSIDSNEAVPLVKRDSATTDREIDRGAEFAVSGEGDTLRIFGHWNNNMKNAGYMDIAAVVIEEDFSQAAVCNWDSWSNNREWSTYSGDTNVPVGGSAAEYVDVDLKKVKEIYPKARYVAMTIESWSGFPMNEVDMIAGAMLRSDANSGEVFDARSVNTAFKPTTESTQSVPFAIDLKSNKLVWLDSSNGSTASSGSSSRDTTIGPIVYDELARPRFTFKNLAKLWAKAHNVETVKDRVNKEQLMKLI